MQDRTTKLKRCVLVLPLVCSYKYFLSKTLKYYLMFCFRMKSVAVELFMPVFFLTQLTYSGTSPIRKGNSSNSIFINS